MNKLKYRCPIRLKFIKDINTLRWCLAVVDEHFQKQQLPVSYTKNLNIGSLEGCHENQFFELWMKTAKLVKILKRVNEFITY